MKRMLVFTSIFYLLLFNIDAQAGLPFLKIFIPKSHPDCEKALPPSHSRFCPSFRTAAVCSCSSSGMPKSMCQNMKSLYKRMITVFDTQQKACEFQKDTSTRTCIDSWNCYRLGGKDSTGKLCQSTGEAC